MVCVDIQVTYQHALVNRSVPNIPVHYKVCWQQELPQAYINAQNERLHSCYIVPLSENIKLALKI